MDIKVKVGDRIKELREAQKLTQQQCAFSTDMDRTFLTHIEKGRKNISLGTLERILVSLNISFKDFFDSKSFE